MFITDYKNVQIVIADGRREISTSYRALQKAYNVSCMCVCFCLEDPINSQQSGGHAFCRITLFSFRIDELLDNWKVFFKRTL